MFKTKVTLDQLKKLEPFAEDTKIHKRFNQIKLNNKTFKVLGTMSGTSLDGIDMSILKTNGINIFEFGPNYFTKFSKELYEKLLFTLTLKDELALHKDFLEDLNLYTLLCSLLNDSITS